MSRTFSAASSQRLMSSNAGATAVPLTMACWFRITGTVATEQTILSLDSPGISQDLFGLRCRSSTVGAAVYNNSSFAAAVASTSITQNQWHHGCAVFAGNASRAAYIDGGSKGTNTTSVAVGTISDTTIGAVQANSSSFVQHTTGDVAEVGVWTVALSDAEVAILALGVSPLLVRPGSLAFYLPLVRDADRDIVGGFAFTSNGSPTVSAHPRVIYPQRTRLTVPVVAGGGGGGGRLLDSLLLNGGRLAGRLVG